MKHCLNSHLEGDDLKCTECEKGYAINTATNQFVESDNCFEVDDNGKCTSCNNKVNIYIRANQKGKCVFDTCKKYDEDGVCKKCNDYFYLNIKKKCSYIKIPFCKKLAEENENECEDTSYFLKGKDSSEYEIAKEEYLSRCEHKNGDICDICESGYEVDSSGKKCVLIGCEELKSLPQNVNFVKMGIFLSMMNLDVCQYQKH